MTEQRPGSSGGGDAYEYHQSTGYEANQRQDEYGDYRSTGERQGSVLDEFRRQMDEMLGGPTARAGGAPGRRGRSELSAGRGTHRNDTGLALAAAAAYWALPLALRKRKRARLRRRAQRQQPRQRYDIGRILLGARRRHYFCTGNWSQSSGRSFEGVQRRARSCCSSQSSR
ncbi:MAG: hypothetical protein U5Q44_04065 [Dehalococcoidia bacterium]|nr:hypothetical protein [Dehalococcoidia bacterium]